MLALRARFCELVSLRLEVGLLGFAGEMLVKLSLYLEFLRLRR